MKDNFNLKKFLTENKTIENSNPYLKENQYEKDAEADDAEHIDALEKDMADDKKSSLRKKVREMIINELTNIEPDPEDLGGYNPEYTDDIPLPKLPSDEDDTFGSDFTITAEGEESLDEAPEEEEEESWIDPAGGVHYDDEDDPAAMYVEESLDEAKEEEEEEVEAEEETPEEEETEEVDVETEEEPETGGGIEDLAADMDGNEGDLMDHLISALKVSKGMDNEKLTTQIGNTLKFFVGEYIGGEE